MQHERQNISNVLELTRTQTQMRRYKKNEYHCHIAPLFFVTSRQIKNQNPDNVNNEREDIVFLRDTVEFVTVAAEFCAYMEHASEHNRKEFVDTLLKLLPLLYLKAQMLPNEESISDDNLEEFVTEDSYEVLRITISELLAEKDSYLDVFVADMKYSDTPITKSISEDLADIYQDIKNFVSLFKLGINETMHDAIVECNEHFKQYWGQTLVNTLRALHDIIYKTTLEEEEEDIDE